MLVVWVATMNLSIALVAHTYSLSVRSRLVRRELAASKSSAICVRRVKTKLAYSKQVKSIGKAVNSGTVCCLLGSPTLC